MHQTLQHPLLTEFLSQLTEETLKELKDLEVKKIFGDYGLFAENMMLVWMVHHALYLRTDQALYQLAKQYRLLPLSKDGKQGQKMYFRYYNIAHLSEISEFNLNKALISSLSSAHIDRKKFENSSHKKVLRAAEKCLIVPE